MQRRSLRQNAHDIAAEIIRRAAATGASGHVVRISKPPARHELLQLLAARRERRPIVVMPHKCASMEEWLARYGSGR